MDARTLTMTFSETVRSSSAFATGVSLWNGDAGSSPISLSSSALSRTTQLVFAVALSFFDARSLSSVEPAVGWALNSTVLFLTSGTIEDGFGNTFSVSDRVATSVVRDGQSPFLEAFNVDLNTNQIILRFSEAVRPATGRPEAITFAGDGGTQYTLTNGSIAGGNESNFVVLQMSTVDVIRIKSDTSLCVSSASCRLTHLSSLIEDAFGNPTEAVGNPVVPSAFEADATPPVLEAAVLDVEHGVLVLKFDEPMNGQAVLFTGIRLQDNQLAFVDSNNVAVNSFNLRGGSTTSHASIFISIDLSYEDLNTVKRLRGLGTRPENTFVSFAQGTFADMAGNAIDELGDGSALGCNAVIEDVTSPVLTNFDFLMSSTGLPLKLRLHFSETVDVETLDLTKVLLQDEQSRSSATKQLRLTSGNARPIP
jgi:hypothetical protein